MGDAHPLSTSDTSRFEPLLFPSNFFVCRIRLKNSLGQVKQPQPLEASELLLMTSAEHLEGPYERRPCRAVAEQFCCYDAREKGFVAGHLLKPADKALQMSSASTTSGAQWRQMFFGRLLHREHPSVEAA